MLTKNLEEYGDILLDKLSDKQLVEIKNCFDNDTFEVCEVKEVPHDTKMMNCVFSYKVNTDSNVDGDEVKFVKFEKHGIGQSTR